MFKTRFLKKLAAQLMDAIPTLKKDAGKAKQRILSKTFDELNIATRDEFETQNKVLLRSRKKIEALEAKIKELETLIKEKQHKK